jgi:cyclase
VAISTRQHFRIERVATGIWAAIARDGGYGLCNAGIVDLGGTTVVYDSMLTPMAGEELRRSARRLTGRDPAVVINSHWHGDHIRGNGAFAPAAIVSTARTRELIRTAGVQQWTSDRRSMPAALASLDAAESDVPRTERALYRGWFEGTLRVPIPFRPAPPNVTFERELSLAGTRRELRVLTYGGGHSPSDVFAFAPEERVAFLGDLVSVGLHPSVGDGAPSPWRRILRRIRRLGIGRAIPGHGPVGGAPQIQQIEHYLADLDRLAGRAFQRGDSRKVLRDVPIPPLYREWRFSAFFAGNLIRAYDLAQAQRVRAG